MQFLLCCFITKQTFALKDTLNIFFQSEKLKIQGKIVAPKNRNIKIPVVIFIVGSGGNSSYKTNYADFTNFFLEQPLENENIALMYFDKRGVGQSEGKWYKTDFDQRALDAKNAAEYLKTLPFVDTQQIYLIGHSQGGWIVQLCLAQYPNTFAGGISMAGATFGVKKQLLNDYRSTFICSHQSDTAKAFSKAKKKVNAVLTFTELFPFKQNWKQLNRIKNFEILNYLSKIEKPILYLWGENDQLVSPQWCKEELNKVFTNGIPENFETHIAKGENHSFKVASFCYKGNAKNLPYSENSREIIIKWLLNTVSSNHKN